MHGDTDYTTEKLILTGVLIVVVLLVAILAIDKHAELTCKNTAMQLRYSAVEIQAICGGTR